MFRRLHPRSREPRQHEDASRRRQRGEAQGAVESDQEDRRARHHEQVGRQLHQALREKLVQLVGIVVDPRDEVAGLVLVEEVERQILQFREQRDFASRTTPAVRRCPSSASGRRSRRTTPGRQPTEGRRTQDAAEVAAPDVGVDRVRDDERPDQPCQRRHDDGNARDGDAFTLGRHERQQARKRRT